MASPQLENGYCAIANEVIDALCRTRIPGEERQCLDFIIRKTYGWRKKTDAISLSQFCDATGIKKPNVVRSLRSLQEKRIIIVIKNDNKIVIKNDNDKCHIYEFNKNYDEWVALSKKITLSKTIKDVIKNDNDALSLLSTTKDTTTKDTNKNNKPSSSVPLKVARRPSLKADLETWIKALGNGLGEWFINEFWPIQVRKVGKKDAVRALFNLQPDEDLRSKIIKAYSSQALSDYSKREIDKVPHPATWINGNRWEDEACRQETWAERKEREIAEAKRIGAVH